MKRCNSSSGSFCFCQTLNISECISIQDSPTTIVSAINTAVKYRNGWIRIPVSLANISVLEFGTFEPVAFELVPIRQETLRIPERQGNSKYEVVFPTEFGMLNERVYIITSDPLLAQYSEKSLTLKLKSDNVIGNDHITLKFDSNGDLVEMKNLDSNVTSQIKQNFCFYKSKIGNLNSSLLINSCHL